MIKLNRLSQWTAFASGIVLLFGCDTATSETSEKNQLPVEKKTSVEDNFSDPNGELDEQTIASITQVIHENVGSVPISKIAHSRMPGVIEVVASGQIIYVSSDRKYLFPGPLLAVESGELVNLTQQSLRQLDMEKAPERAKLIAAVPEQEMVVFRSSSEKYIVNVFTDVDCAYCRKLHQNMQAYLDAGITIRYLAFPRAGVGSGSYNKLVSVWCSENQQSAMDNAKLHNQFDTKDCPNPVADQYSLTRQMGLSGTPALILSDGELIAGFVEPDRLIKLLQAKEGS